VVTCNHNSIECKEIDLGTFLGIAGASERISLAAMTQATERHGTEPAICRWICFMLESRNIMTTFTGELNDDDCYTTGYADYIATLINAKFHQTVSEVS
jgi:hypothetical protein